MRRASPRASTAAAFALFLAAVKHARGKLIAAVDAAQEPECEPLEQLRRCMTSIMQFFDAHPESTRQNAWLTSHPVPASYAGVNYFGVHAFTFTNAAGDSKVVKYKAIPEAGELGLTPDEAKAKGPDFYADELKERLAKGPIAFDLVAILGQKGDPTNDPTVRWDDEDTRVTAPLGKVMIEAIAPDATCNTFSFLPANVPDGIVGPTDDPIFAVRSPAYVVSLIRRKAP